MKAGILYPRSKAHPNMMVDFMDGVKIFLKHRGLTNDIELLAESVGFGGNEKEVYEKAEKLLLLDEADLLVAYVDFRVLPVLEPLLYSTGKLMIVVNTGANYPQNWVPQPSVVYLTLQHGFSCWLTGLLAGEEAAAVATSFYDCGYLHTAAITKGLMKNGGTIRYNYVNNNLYDSSFEINPLAAFLAAEPATTNMVCVFDSLPASLFYKRVNELEGSDRFHLLVSPMMLEEQALSGIGPGFNFSVNGYTSYDASSGNEANTVFKSVFEQQTKKKPSLFTLQGWEAAMVLEKIMTADIAGPADGAAARNALITTTIDSPRGALTFDPDTHYFLPPVYKYSINKNTNAIIITPTANTGEEWKNFVANPVEGVTSGWTNTYLCY